MPSTIAHYNLTLLRLPWLVTMPTSILPGFPWRVALGIINNNRWTLRSRSTLDGYEPTFYATHISLQISDDPSLL